MKKIVEYNLKNIDDDNHIRCQVEYNTENDYDTTYYFFDGKDWQKDFIDLNKLTPENKDEQEAFEDFVTNVHDYMVHGSLWDDLKKMDLTEKIINDDYNLEITAKQI